MANSPLFKVPTLKQRTKDGTVDFDTDTIKVALLDNTFEIITARANSTAYALGDFYKNSNNYYRCIKAGTSDASPPTFTTNLTAFADGTAIFQDVGTSQFTNLGLTSIWARTNSTAILEGQMYIPTTANGHWYVATVAGTTAASEPTYKTDGTTFSDGTATMQDMGLYTERPKYVPDSSFSVFADVSATEISGTGYTAGGQALANPTVSAAGVFDADDVIWTNSTITALYAVIYRTGTVNSLTDPLLMFSRLGDSQVSSTNTDFLIRWNTEGILK